MTGRSSSRPQTGGCSGAGTRPGRLEVDEIEAKFLANAERAVGRRRGSAIHEAVMSLDEADSLDGLIEMVSSGPSAK